MYERGWDRSLNVSAIANYRSIRSGAFPELPETPSYFKKEVKQYSEMNYEELRRYIRDLQQRRIRRGAPERATSQKAVVSAYHSDHGRAGDSVFDLDGKAGSGDWCCRCLRNCVFYIVVTRFFEAMGNHSLLPPAFAAWSPDLIFILVGGYLILKVPT